jgi:3-hydroxyacyl-CoA dehydrogenase
MKLEGKCESPCIRPLTHSIHHHRRPRVHWRGYCPQHCFERRLCGGEAGVPRLANSQLFDILPCVDAEALIKTFDHADRYFYERSDIVDEANMQRACASALRKIPKGSLFGAVHCAGIAPGAPWTNSMLDKLADFNKVMHVNATGTFILDGVVADAINSQYPPLEVFHDRVTEERGVIINLSSVVGHDIPARSLTYGVSKSK